MYSWPVFVDGLYALRAGGLSCCAKMITKMTKMIRSRRVIIFVIFVIFGENGHLRTLADMDRVYLADVLPFHR